MDDVTHQPIADFFDRECCAATQQRGADADALDRSEEALLAALDEIGVATGTVLELGSGDGALSRELARRGARRVLGIDLSPQSVGYAAARTASTGLGEQVSFRVGDAASARVEGHDAVISAKVFCCFPDPRALLANTLPAAGSAYALVLPESRGIFGLGARLFVLGANAWQWLRRDAFRAYIHDISAIDAAIRAAGFSRRVSRRVSIWRVLAYSRD